MPAVALPDIYPVARFAKNIITAITRDPSFAQFQTGACEHTRKHTTLSGHLLIDGYDCARDTVALFTEALRATALKTAVRELGRSDDLAALPMPLPIDAMAAAQSAQHTVLRDIESRVRVGLYYATDSRRTLWEEGDYADRAYRAAWGTPHPRYWIGRADTLRRLSVLKGKWASIGIREDGRIADHMLVA